MGRITLLVARLSENTFIRYVNENINGYHKYIFFYIFLLNGLEHHKKVVFIKQVKHVKPLVRPSHQS